MSFRTELSMSALGSQGLHDSYKPERPQSSLEGLAKESFESPPLSASTQATRKWFSTRNMFIGTVAFIGGAILLGSRYLAPVQTIGPEVPDPKPDFNQQMKHFVGARKFKEAQDHVNTLPQEEQIKGLQEMIRLTAKHSLPTTLKVAETIIHHPFSNDESLQEICSSLAPAVMFAHKKKNSLAQMFDLPSQGISNETKNTFFSFLSRCLMESNAEFALTANTLDHMMDRDRHVIINKWLEYLQNQYKKEEQIDYDIKVMAKEVQAKGVAIDHVINIIRHIKDPEIRDIIIYELIQQLQNVEQIMKYARLFSDPLKLYGILSSKIQGTQAFLRETPILPNEETKQLLLLIHQEHLLSARELSKLVIMMSQRLNLKEAVDYFKAFKPPLNGQEISDPNAFINRENEDFLSRVKDRLILRAEKEEQDELKNEIHSIFSKDNP